MPVVDCKVAIGRMRLHVAHKCAACKQDGYPAFAFACPAKKTAKTAAMNQQGARERGKRR